MLQWNYSPLHAIRSDSTRMPFHRCVSVKCSVFGSSPARSPEKFCSVRAKKSVLIPSASVVHSVGIRSPQSKSVEGGGKYSVVVPRGSTHLELTINIRSPSKCLYRTPIVPVSRKLARQSLAIMQESARLAPINTESLIFEQHRRRLDSTFVEKHSRAMAHL